MSQQGVKRLPLPCLGSRWWLQSSWPSFSPAVSCLSFSSVHSVSSFKTEFSFYLCYCLWSGRKFLFSFVPFSSTTVPLGTYSILTPGNRWVWVPLHAFSASLWVLYLFNSITSSKAWQHHVRNQVLRAFPGTWEPWSESVDYDDGDWSGAGVTCWELNKKGEKGRARMDPRVSVPSSAFISKSSARPSGLFSLFFGKSCRLSLSKMVPPLTRPCQGANLHSLIVGGKS